MTRFINKLKEKNKAFTLFVSLIVASLLLAVGFSIGNILIKQLTLASSGSGSLVAFYAADSAAECAMYWDRKNSAGFTVADSPFSTSTIGDVRIVCGKGTGTGDDDDDDPITGLVYGFKKVCDDSVCGVGATTATTVFYVDTSDPTDPASKSCAFVTVVKTYNPSTGIEDTSIDARGYNGALVIDRSIPGYGMDHLNPNVKCDLGQPKTVERGIFINY